MRYCKLCNNHVVGYECSALVIVDLKKKKIPRYYLHHCNMMKFNDIMSTVSTKLLFRISKCIVHTLPLLSSYDGAVVRMQDPQSQGCEFESRCNRLRCPLARLSGLQCFTMGHVVMILMGN